MSTYLRGIMLAAVLSVGASGIAMASTKATILNETPVAASEIAADAIVVRIKAMKFDTPELTVKAGTTVVWINDEVMPHNVAFKAGVVDEKSTASAMMKKEQAISITFDTPGTYEYFCTPHPFMRAKVIVE